MTDDIAAFHARHHAVIEMQAEPQIAQAVTLMSASRGCSILGSGTVSQRMSPLPCHVKAFTKLLSHHDPRRASRVPAGPLQSLPMRNLCAGSVISPRGGAAFAIGRASGYIAAARCPAARRRGHAHRRDQADDRGSARLCPAGPPGDQGGAAHRQGAGGARPRACAG